MDTPRSTRRAGRRTTIFAATALAAAALGAGVVLATSGADDEPAEAACTIYSPGYSPFCRFLPLYRVV